MEMKAKREDCYWSQFEWRGILKNAPKWARTFMGASVEKIVWNVEFLYYLLNVRGSTSFSDEHGKPLFLIKRNSNRVRIS